MLVHVGTRCSQRPRQTSAPAARKTSRSRYSNPRQRRNDQALARWPIACSTSARSPACTRLNACCPAVSRSLVRRSPTGACQCSRGLATPRNPRSTRPDGGDARRFSFADLAASSNRAARFLGSLGLGKGDPVFVMLPRIPEWYDVVLGCIKLGAVPMPGTTLLTARDIDYRLERAGARVAVTDPEGADKVDQAAKRMGVDLTRILVRSQEAGGPSSGWASWEDGLESASDQPPAVEPTRSDDPILVYFTSGTVAYATVGFLPRSRHAADLHKYALPSRDPTLPAELVSIGLDVSEKPGHRRRSWVSTTVQRRGTAPPLD
jgi:AMP-binding enzyme